MQVLICRSGLENAQLSSLSNVHGKEKVYASIP
jgi:hypothetical protein